MRLALVVLVFVSGCRMTRSFEVSTTTAYTNNGDPVVATTVKQSWNW